MDNSIEKAHILHVSLPFRKEFKHAIVTRSYSDSIFLRLFLEDGTVGYGESLPREYVTGETPRSIIGQLKEILKEYILGYAPYNYLEVLKFIDNLTITGAGRCLLELALLDVYGRYFKTSAVSIIGGEVYPLPVYSGVIQSGSIQNAIKMSMIFKAFGLRFIKVKVGIDNDIPRLAAIRAILGKDVNIRVDANGIWNADEAIRKIEKMRKFNISAVEQPVGRSDYEGLKIVTDSVTEEIIADESICTRDDAIRLAKLRACNIFNIRLSKCGGLLASLEIADIAKQYGIGVQLGCQVGESGILSAAGLYFAMVCKDLIFCEGMYGKYLLREDVTEEDMSIRKGGRPPSINGPGLGVNVLDNILEKYTISKEVIS